MTSILKKPKIKSKDSQSSLKKHVLAGSQSLSNTFVKDEQNLLDLVNAQGAVICLGDRISTIGVCPPQSFIGKLGLKPCPSRAALYSNLTTNTANLILE